MYATPGAYLPGNITRGKTSGNLIVPIIKNVEKAFNMHITAYTHDFFETALTYKQAAQFSYAINAGLAYNYPDCKTIGSCVSASNN